MRIQTSEGLLATWGAYPALQGRRKPRVHARSFVNATVAYNGSCKINGASAALWIPTCGVDMNYSRSAIDAHLVRVDTGDA